MLGESEENGPEVIRRAGRRGRPVLASRWSPGATREGTSRSPGATHPRVALVAGATCPRIALVAGGDPGRNELVAGGDLSSRRAGHRRRPGFNRENFSRCFRPCVAFGGFLFIKIRFSEL
ncbi:hypothetical protein DY000_02047952 [Brassica cretica]|uniref:Uncharacterized protein n=1 Tax=Brassica cretica TaxID=69181 RepID=A0ABQ7F0R0_BRACR|nr:hypothetical protein DY000_02047952 [Brassica cretica]